MRREKFDPDTKVCKERRAGGQEGYKANERKHGGAGVARKEAGGV